MCRKNTSAFWLAMLVIVSPAIGQVTTWTDSSGTFSVEAELVAATSEQATLRKADGKEIQVPLARLSQDSRKLVDAWNAKKSKQVGTGSVEISVIALCR